MVLREQDACGQVLDHPSMYMVSMKKLGNPVQLLRLKKLEISRHLSSPAVIQKTTAST